MGILSQINIYYSGIGNKRVEGWARCRRITAKFVFPTPNLLTEENHRSYSHWRAATYKTRQCHFDLIWTKMKNLHLPLQRHRTDFSCWHSILHTFSKCIFQIPSVVINLLFAIKATAGDRWNDRTYLRIQQVQPIDRTTLASKEFKVNSLSGIKQQMVPESKQELGTMPWPMLCFSSIVI